MIFNYELRFVNVTNRNSYLKSFLLNYLHNKYKSTKKPKIRTFDIFRFLKTYKSRFLKPTTTALVLPQTSIDFNLWELLQLTAGFCHHTVNNFVFNLQLRPFYTDPSSSKASDLQYNTEGISKQDDNIYFRAKRQRK